MSRPIALIIEDDPRLFTVYQVTLQQAGFDTVLDTTGNQYNTLTYPVPPALIILDLHMPFASGLDILQEIRCGERLARVPVIVTTADIILAKSVKGQADEVLIKPVSVARLREAALRLHPPDTTSKSSDPMS